MPDLFDDSPRPTAQLDGAACGHCGGRDLVFRWQEIAGGRKHLRADCAACGRYVKFVAQRPDLIALVEPTT